MIQLRLALPPPSEPQFYGPLAPRPGDPEWAAFERWGLGPVITLSTEARDLLRLARCLPRGAERDP